MSVAQVDVVRELEKRTPRELASILLGRLSNYMNDSGVKVSLNAVYWLQNAVDMYMYQAVYPQRHLKLVITTRDGLQLEIHWYTDDTLYYEIRSLHTAYCHCGE